jgi:hypothetical protein
MRKPSSLKTMLAARLMVVALGLCSFSGPTLADEIAVDGVSMSRGLLLTNDVTLNNRIKLFKEICLLNGMDVNEDISLVQPAGSPLPIA